MACGQRKVTISKCQKFLGMIDYAPHNLMLNHQPGDLKTLLNFRHNTFSATDTLHFIRFLRNYYQQHDMLEEAFL